MATTLKKTNVVIVGLGAAGGVACLPLAQAGIDVIGLDAGPRLNTRDMAPDELRLNRRVWPPGPQKTRAKRRHRGQMPSGNAIQGGHPMMNAVGGTSIHYWGQSWRLNPWDFKVRSETVRRYGASRIPKGSTIEDWPFSYDELEPLLRQGGVHVGVSGKAGNINGKLDERGNIFEAPRKREFPMPALRTTGFTEKMAAAAKSLGWHPAPGPAAVATKSYEGRPGCAYHGYCSGAGCHINAKSSTAVTTIPLAEKTGHFSVVSEARVTAVEVDNNGRVTGVTYVKGGHGIFSACRCRTRCRIRLREFTPVAAVEIETLSERGCRTIMARLADITSVTIKARRVAAMFPFNLNNWYGLPAQGIAVDNWADDNFDHSGLDFIGGGGMYVYTERRPIASVNGLAGWLNGTADVGLGMEGFRQDQRRPHQQRLPAKNNAALRRQLSGSGSERERPVRLAGDSHHGRVQG